MAKSTIKLTPTPYAEVLDVLKSDSLRRVEEAIASMFQQPILRDYSSIYISPTQAAMSVSGMSPAQIQKFIDNHQEQLIAFGIRFHQDSKATQAEEEYPK